MLYYICILVILLTTIMHYICTLRCAFFVIYGIIMLGDNMKCPNCNKEMKNNYCMVCGYMQNGNFVGECINEKNNDIRITSLARDTYVDIEGYGTEKLTHAYAYEGASLLISTIKNNFGIDVDKYIAVSFESFEKIIDILGGVEINVSEKEVSQINGVNNSGIQTLNGSQALAYSRIRYIDSAYERDNRQRTVIEALYNKFANGSSDNIM